MRRLCVLHIIAGLNDGGAEAVLFRLVGIGPSETRHVVVSLSDAGKYGPLLEAKGIKTHYLCMRRGSLSLAGFARLVRILRQEQPAVVQTWMYHANLIGGVSAYLAGYRRIFWSLHHGQLSRHDSKLTTRIVNWLSGIVAHLVPKKIIAVSDYVRDSHKQYGNMDSFVVIPNGCDTGRFSPIASKQHISRISIGMVARWAKEKDHRTLFAAIRLLLERGYDCELILAGMNCDADNAELNQNLHQMNLHERTTLLGSVENVPSVMNSLDVHVLSSYQEAFGNVVIEAMACGTPCVVTDVGDAERIVGETGWVVPPRDPVALANAMVTALSERANVDKWSERQRSARKRVVEEFSLKAMAARYNAVWTLD